MRTMRGMGPNRAKIALAMLCVVAPACCVGCSGECSAECSSYAGYRARFSGTPSEVVVEACWNDICSSGTVKLAPNTLSSGDCGFQSNVVSCRVMLAGEGNGFLVTVDFRPRQVDDTDRYRVKVAESGSGHVFGDDKASGPYRRERVCGSPCFSLLFGNDAQG
ncbi:MAG: hypothetical protein HY898_30050 [Deltaproteobacteria bacterium]|nr:hypothetical protein [Deltaproteobacteria bacterium]